ncbi:uncharacterized protein N0V89_005881 [Didymosphaeria variabile]|uniref:Uncharacterized protein n=1 Tax=Didymosphaeria variabile TaxID=1932322 RepID=A0A9W8XN14_9PLEO|nr:uncharacterized protein N0V89_005881 [Didymosphaeria variabile]KAJ4354148.1 hypothetical protein N0V89_005881 [Didymosphaeria variabile]
MRTSFAVLALLGAVPTFAAAYPASSSYGSGPDDTPSTPTYGSGSGTGSSSASGDAPDFSNDGACTLYKAKNLAGKTSPTDYTPIPADSGCLDLSSLYGAWEGKTRSLVVQEGYKCDFYTDFTCPTSSTPLCLNASDKKITKKTLPAAWDQKIKSVKCEKMETSKPKPKPSPKPTPSEAPSSSY